MISLSCDNSCVDLSPGTAIYENTVSPGNAYGGCSNVNSTVPEPLASVPVNALLNVTS